MQLLPPLTRDPRIIAREKSAGAHLPYARHVDDHTIETRSGLLLQVIALRGLLFETADSAELNYRKTLRDAMLRAIGSSRFALYHHVVRRRVDVALDADFPDPFSLDLDRRWRAKLEGRQLYANELFLTLIRRPLQGRMGLLDKVRTWVGATGVDRAQQVGIELSALNEARDALIAALGSYGPRLLGVYQTPQGLCSEPLEFLGGLFNGTTTPMLLPFGDLGENVARRRISFGQNAFERAADGLAPRAFGAIMSVKDYAGHTAAGMFDELLRLPVNMVVSQSFAFVERGASLSAMNLALRRMRAADDEAMSLREELLVAKDSVAAGRAGFGEHHMTIAVEAEDLDTLNGNVSEVAATLADLGILAVREDIGLEPAFWAQFPANFPYIARRGLVSTANFAGLASAHSFASGSHSGNHWGEAVTLLETTAAGPYFFNFHHGDLGNFTVIGPSGSGKTVVLNFLLAQARKFDPRIVFFDKDRGAELFIRAVGGRYDRLDPAVPSGLNPLQFPDTPGNRALLADWLTTLAGGADVEEMARINAAIDANFTVPSEYRRLCHLVELFRGQARPAPNDLYARLEPWWGNGAHAWLFDNELDRTDLTERVVGFDMTAILDDPMLRTPAMMVLFHRVEERLDGSPAIIVVDEGWKALDDDVFVRRIKDWEKTIRKMNGIVGFATQSARDALDSRIASAIVEQAATQIFMINPKASEEDYCRGFGLTLHELDLVRTLPDSAHCFLVRHGNESAVVRLDLSGEKDFLTILSGRERTVRLLDNIRAETGDDPQAWLPRLLEAA
ncbi:VirB4 family type IV secretion/conjugal transfer ATPase [Sandaracinobacteroides saxicola]|uniref:Type IV secretion system protein virB4 n=1 Tax=Sandaracinobacteroides saxicola TaxID=2759707 RepID=A0A7G5IGH1_9SPHN|nr:VirB4 family type IV secretion/conjugal transfer ATPase [Sandaracinobacteroides saxicola]QMW22463.1 VirB4 family type IV secretion/conjugal transfer ATPase [Sandaracinobacteroides saxicola]